MVSNGSINRESSSNLIVPLAQEEVSVVDQETTLKAQHMWPKKSHLSTHAQVFFFFKCALEHIFLFDFILFDS